MKTVKIGQLPGRIVEIALEDNMVVGHAVEIAELNPEGFEVRVNGTLASLETAIANGDTILLAKKIKGNSGFITVKIGQLPGRIVEIGLDNGATVGDAITTAELNSDGFEVRVNGVMTDAETVLSNGDTILLAKKIKGN